MQKQLVTALLLAAISGCADPSQAPILDDVETPLRANPRGTVDHGALPFFEAVPLSLSSGATSHRYSLSLTAQATVTLATQPDATGAEVDTVLSLYRSAPQLTKPFARNDDHGDARFSQLTRTLQAGNYVVDVSGFKRTTRGSFALFATCEGAGCPVQASQCLLGSSFYELRTGQVEGLVLGAETWIRDVSALDALAREQLVLAVHESSHTDVTTAEEALARVDQNEARWLEVTHAHTQRAYTAVEYGAGDNSYGAIFERGTTRIAASIHDGDLLQCEERE